MPQNSMDILEDIVLEQECESMENTQEAFQIKASDEVSPDLEIKEEDETPYKGKTVSLFGDRINREEKIRKNEMAEIMEAMKVKRRFEGVIQAVKIDDEDEQSRFGVYFILYYGTSGLQIRIPAEEFYVNIPLHPTKYNNGTEEISQKAWCIWESKAFIGAPIDYQITKPVGNVLFASRLQAMRQKELQYFFNSDDERCIKKYDKTDARVESVRRDRLIVDIGGVQTDIDMEGMGYQFVFDARKEYQIGMCFQIIVTDLVLNTDQKKVESLSVSRKELPYVRKSLERKMKQFEVGTKYMGEVAYKQVPTEDKEGFYIVSFYNETMRSLHAGRDSEAWLCDCHCTIPKSFSPRVGEKVFVKIKRFDEKNLKLFGKFE